VYTCMLLPATSSCGLAPFSVEKDGESWHYHVVLQIKILLCGSLGEQSYTARKPGYWVTVRV
jgi:hypothetical protein